jgi:predicted alpha-1,6-mannanase (GH76 family)
MYEKLPAVIDNCFDDHQWFLLGWIRAYEATLNVSYIQRAAIIFDFVATKGWETTLCGGGVTWCPPPTGPYKNAITSELFFASAMGLAPYESIVSKPTGYYTSWGSKIWSWLEQSTMLNNDFLFNDGLNSGTCLNNGQKTWTYNQGVVLSGLARLSVATSNNTLLQIAEKIARSAMANLSIDGILTEPCDGGSCDNDQRIFKGVFVRHLAILTNLASSSSFKTDASIFLASNALALERNGAGGCSLAGSTYPMRWDGPCDSSADVATTAAALDAFAAASKVNVSAPIVSWMPLGFGNCADTNGDSMANCYASNVLDERACRDAAWTTRGSIAYDFSFSDCLGGTFCRVRTLAGSGACSGGFSWANGSATTITTTVDGSRSICVIRT